MLRAAFNWRRKTSHESANSGSPSGMVMSQNMRAVWMPESSSNGSGWYVDGAGRSSVSDSEMRENPSMEEPSKPTPSSKALSSSAGDIITVFKLPNMSVNQSG